MLVKESFDFLFINVAHGVGGHGDDVAVFVRARGGEVVDGCGVFDVREVVAEDAEVEEVGGGKGFARVVGEALVAGLIVIVVDLHGG